MIQSYAHFALVSGQSNLRLSTLINSGKQQSHGQLLLSRKVMIMTKDFTAKSYRIF